MLRRVYFVTLRAAFGTSYSVMSRLPEVRWYLLAAVLLAVVLAAIVIVVALQGQAAGHAYPIL